MQSSTMALMAAKGEITPMPDAAIFADTQGEPKSVYDWLDYLITLLPYKVHVITYGNLMESELRVRRSSKSGKLYRRSGIPGFVRGHGMLRRQCTADYKVRPIIRYLRKLGEVPRGCKEVRLVQWIGISRDEAHRMKDAPHPWIENRWPLVDMNMTRADCLTWMKERGYPEPPRSACTFCPFHSDKEWVRLKREEPEEFQGAVELERKIHEAAKEDEVAWDLCYLHRKRIPLDQVVFKEEEKQPDLWGNECEGMCGV